MDIISLVTSCISDFYNAHPILIGILVSIATILPLIQILFHGITRFVSWLRNIAARLSGRPIIPRQTLSILPEGNSLFCNTGMFYNEPATSLRGAWYITNITDRPVSLLAARIKSPRKAAGTEASIKESVLQPDGSPQRIPIQFLIYPAVHQEGKPFKATIVFVDQYRNEHIFKNLLFKVPPHILFRSE
jgi:hypothetical protein